MSKIKYLEPGDKYKCWTVICYSGQNKWGHQTYLCACKCGLEVVKVKHYITAINNSFMCHKCAMEEFYKMKSLEGMIFGNSLVERYSPVPNDRRGAFYEVRCLLCNKIRKLQGYGLKRGKNSSCDKCAKNMRKKVKNNEKRIS